MKSQFLRKFVYCLLGLLVFPLSIYWLTISLAKAAYEGLAPILVLIHMFFFVYFMPVVVLFGRESFKVGNLLSIDLGGPGSVAKTVILYTGVSASIAYGLAWYGEKKKRNGMA